PEPSAIVDPTQLAAVVLVPLASVFQTPSAARPRLIPDKSAAKATTFTTTACILLARKSVPRIERRANNELTDCRVCSQTNGPILWFIRLIACCYHRTIPAGRQHDIARSPRES